MADPRRSGPPPLDHAALLRTLADLRRALVEARRGMRPRSGLARCMDAVIEDIDELALVLTGDRAHFHARGHSARAPGD
ncbi:hypothetical protein [Stappia sp.]|uniref:hypothetical protein n=1 Tax=Stappia sp. TaxID=1870903 RepID=UPI0032D91231